MFRSAPLALMRALGQGFVGRAQRTVPVAVLLAGVIGAYWTWTGGYDDNWEFCDPLWVETYKFGAVAMKWGNEYCRPDLPGIVTVTLALAGQLFVPCFLGISLVHAVLGNSTRRSRTRWPSLARVGQFAVATVGLALLGAVLDTAMLLGNPEIGAKILCPPNYGEVVGGIRGALAGTCDLNVEAFVGTVLTTWALFVPFAAAAVAIASKLIAVLKRFRRRWREPKAPAVLLIAGQGFVLAAGRVVVLVVHIGFALVLVQAMKVVGFGAYLAGTCEPISLGAPYRFGVLAAFDGQSYCLPNIARLWRFGTETDIAVWFAVFLVVAIRLGLGELADIVRPVDVPPGGVRWRRIFVQAGTVIALALLGALIHTTVVLPDSSIGTAYLCPPIPSGGCGFVPDVLIGTALMTALAWTPFAVAAVALVSPARSPGRRLRARPAI